MTDGYLKAWILTQNRTFEITLMSNFWQCYVNNLVGPQNVDQLNLVNCRAIVTWIVAYAGKVAYAGFSLKVLFHYSAVKVFHVYDISNLIFLHSNCIDSIYRNPGGLVVWYLKRWPGFDSQPVSILSTVNYLQLMICF